MRVRMTRQRVLQDAGRERPLVVGVEYELPDPVAQSLVASGAAEAVVEEERAARRAPETKPTRAPERKAVGA